MTTTVLITGNTFPVKDALRALGGRWDPAAKGWRVPANQADQARALVAAAPAKQRTGSPGRQNWRPWRPCGYPGCSRSWCDECDGEGYRPGR